MVTIEYTIDYNRKEGSTGIVDVDIDVTKWNVNEIYAILCEKGEIEEGKPYRYFDVRLVTE